MSQYAAPDRDVRLLADIATTLESDYLGISPHDAHCRVVSKRLLQKHVIGVSPQHTGARGTDTFWLSVDPDAPPGWLEACGGRLADACDIIKRW